MKYIITAGAIILSAACLSAQADVMTMRVQAAPATVDLNSAEAFAFYGDANNAVDTDVANLGNFTVPTYITQSDPGFGTPGSSGVTGSSYTAVSYDSGAPATSISSSTDFAAVGFEDGSSLSVSTNLIASSETLQFYLTDYNATSDLTLMLGTSTFTLDGAVLPTSVDGLGDGTGTGTNSALFTVTVSGSTGELLTFTDTSDETGAGNSALGNVGLQAIAVTSNVAPEPSTWRFLVIGGLMLFVVARRTRWLEKP